MGRRGPELSIAAVQCGRRGGRANLLPRLSLSDASSAFGSKNLVINLMVRMHHTVLGAQSFQ